MDGFCITAYSKQETSLKGEDCLFLVFKIRSVQLWILNHDQGWAVCAAGVTQAERPMAEVAVFISTVWFLKLKGGPFIQNGLHIFAILEMMRNHRTASSLCGNQVHTQLAMRGSGEDQLYLKHVPMLI